MKNGKTIKYLRIACLTILVLSFFTAQMRAEESVLKPSDEAIVVLSTVTISEMRYARKMLERNGVVVHEIYPPSVFIGTVPRHLAGSIKEFDFIEDLSHGKIDSNRSKDYETPTLDVINLWNQRLDEQTPPKKEKILTGPFKDDVVISDNLPKTKEEKLRKDEEYKRHWKEKKAQIENKEKQKKDAWKGRHGKQVRTESQDKMLTLSSPKGRDSSGVLGDNSFNKAYGAGYYDTSLYVAGDIAVGIFFVSGNLGSWTSDKIDQTFTATCNALNGFIVDEPNAHITFTFVKEVDEAGNPNSLPANERDYVNDLRNTYNTHWAYMIKVINQSGGAQAEYFGPSLHVSFDTNTVYDFETVVRHETMHIFGAWDQYDNSADNDPIKRWGYLNVVNANAKWNSRKGYFGGRGEGLVDLMNEGGPIGVYSRGQIGWRDRDGNGILDPMDTFPMVILSKSGTNPITYIGKAADQALANEFGYFYADILYYSINRLYGDVTINTITQVEYRINGGAWCLAQATDGAFDSAEEDFTFTLPPLKNGKYTVEARAANSVGNAEVSYAKDEITITGSTEENVRPFAVFTITPSKGSIYTNFIFDASNSSDIEDGSDNFQVRWDFENDGVWDTAFSTTKIASFMYSTPGTKTIKLEVRDSGGLSHIITKQLDVANRDLPPSIFLKAVPENQHGNNPNAFTVTVDASGSYDAEDGSNIQVRWDFDDDGTWDTDYSNTMTVQYTYALPQKSQHWRIRGEVKDSRGNISQATRDPWAVAYNHPPEISNIEFYKESGFNVVGRYQLLEKPQGVCVSGHYAYIADGRSGLQILDISNHSHPVLAGIYATSGFARHVFVVGNYAYLAEGEAGLEIVDISRPSLPVHVGICDTPGFARGVFVSGDYAYVADGTSGLQIVDVRNPAFPQLITSCAVSTWTMDVFISGNFAYVTDFLGGFKIIDISNPTSPIQRGFYYIQFADGIYVQGDYAYIAADNSGLKIVNVKDPDRPSLVANYPSRDYTCSVCVLGNLAYLADGDAGLQVLDITNTPPSFVDNYSTFRDAVDVFVSDDYIYVASGGLEIIENQQVPTWKARVIASDPDLGTTWDGLLEYQWDFENDGVWDIRFSATNDKLSVSNLSSSKIACQAKDRFGATAVFTSDLPDVLPPTGTISINNNGSYTNTISVTLNLSAVDAGSGMGSGAQMQFSDDNINWSTPEPYVITKGWILSSGDGIKTVYVKFADVAGNWSQAYSNTITLDTTPPTRPTVIGTAVIIIGNLSELSASWRSSDAVSGIAEYRYRITEGSPSGKLIRNWTSTGTKSSIKIRGLRLQRNKIYYIAVKAKNGAGLWSNIGYSNGIRVKKK